MEKIKIKEIFRLIGLTAGLTSILVWLYIFFVALVLNQDYIVRITIKADEFNEFWAEFVFLGVGLAGLIYEIYKRGSEGTKKD